MKQLVVALSEKWSDVEGTLYRFEKKDGRWLSVGKPVVVAFGEQGMVWDILNVMQESVLDGIESCQFSGPQKRVVSGEYEPSSGDLKIDALNPSKTQFLHHVQYKVEGDYKTPAGMFALGTIFGDEKHRRYAKKMPFTLITKDLECVDDPGSVYYNRLVRSSEVAKDWKSSEKMQEIGDVYSLGLVIEQNYDNPAPGKGSAIFMHIWRERGKGSAGCTVMAEEDLCELVSWLDETSSPHIVQMPRSIYEEKRSSWNLPVLEDQQT